MKTTIARKRKKGLWRKNFLRIVTWNIRSWNTKDLEILLELNNKNIDICAISRTKKKGKGIKPCHDYILLLSAVDKAKRGKGVDIHNKL